MAKSVSEVTGARLIRLQCYEGRDEAKALQAGYALVGLFREPVSASSMCAARARALRPSGLRSARRRATRAR